MFFFFFKQKTAYELRISDWSSDVCSSDLWDRILQHPVTGTVLAVDRYRRNEDMARFLQARDVHCRFPGCRMPARVCDHDHNLDWALGDRKSTRLNSSH